ncbi:hypothetical protein ES708_31129 [subsurface metagenome]|jgi:hypothetical protein
MNQLNDQELEIYEITNRSTGEKHFAASYSAEEACKQAGWLIGNCFVREVKPQRKARKDDHSAMLVKIPCEVCPFQYAECRKPAKEDCPTRPSAPELQNWLKQAAESHLCDYVGQELSQTDYHLNRKWLPMQQAIEELGDHH